MAILSQSTKLNVCQSVVAAKSPNLMYHQTYKRYIALLQLCRSSAICMPSVVGHCTYIPCYIFIDIYALTYDTTYLPCRPLHNFYINDIPIASGHN